MEPDKNTSSESDNQPQAEPDTASETPTTPEGGNSAEQAPVDALSLTPEELEQEEAAQIANGEISPVTGEPIKKLPFFKQLFRKVNVYLLIFVLLVVIAGAIAVVNFLNSQKTPPAPNVATQALTPDALKQLANSDTSVGNTSQTLTIQGNAIIAGQTLTRGNLNVAGSFQTGGNITTPNITVSGTSNLGSTQINSLQVAQNTAIQGSTTLRDLNVAGTSSFGGAITASQLTVTNLILSGNASLEIPNHLRFSGPSPSRTVTPSVLGNGGTASVNGSDTSGTININTGSNTVPGCFAHITFQQAYSNQPHVIVTPIGSAAGQTQYYVNRNPSGFDMCTNNAAPTNQTFAFDFFVTN